MHRASFGTRSQPRMEVPMEGLTKTVQAPLLVAMNATGFDMMLS